jgi:hypothetical protein
MILEVYSHLPINENLRALVSNMLSLCIYLVANDNEDNALICIRFAMDLHKFFRPTLGEFVSVYFTCDCTHVTLCVRRCSRFLIQSTRCTSDCRKRCRQSSGRCASMWGERRHVPHHSL